MMRSASMAPRAPHLRATSIAAEIGSALSREPAYDVAGYLRRTHGGDRQQIYVVMRDGGVSGNTGQPLADRHSTVGAGDDGGARGLAPGTASRGSDPNWPRHHRPRPGRRPAAGDGRHAAAADGRVLTGGGADVVAAGHVLCPSSFVRANRQFSIGRLLNCWKYVRHLSRHAAASVACCCSLASTAAYRASSTLPVERLPPRDEAARRVGAARVVIDQPLPQRAAV